MVLAPLQCAQALAPASLRRSAVEGAALRWLRVEILGLGQGDLAQHFEEQRSRVSEVEHGKRPLTRRSLSKWAAVLKVRPSALLAFLEDVEELLAGVSS